VKMGCRVFIGTPGLPGGQTHALPPPELVGIAIRYIQAVPAVRAQARNRNVHFPVKSEFARGYPKRTRAIMKAFPPMNAADNLFQNVVGNVPDVIGQVFRRQSNGVSPFFLVMPLISALLRLFFRQGKILARPAVVVEQRRMPGRKKFAKTENPATGIRIRRLFHVRKNSRHHFLILLFRILAIENAVFLGTQSHASKEKCRVKAVPAVEDIVRIVYAVTEENPLA
jgi:hypothetical protein